MTFSLVYISLKCHVCHCYLFNNAKLFKFFPVIIQLSSIVINQPVKTVLHTLTSMIHALSQSLSLPLTLTHTQMHAHTPKWKSATLSSVKSKLKTFFFSEFFGHAALSFTPMSMYSVCVCVCVCVCMCMCVCVCACILDIVMPEPLLTCTLCVNCLLNSG